MILVPVKHLSRAKQRLARVLGQSARTELACQMLVDVVEALSDHSQSRVALVTSDRFALQLADSRGLDVIHDTRNRSETDAIEAATEVAAGRGEESTLVLPADIPLLEAEDIRAIYQAAPKRGSVLVPSRDQRGTNAVLRRPAALFPLAFGTDSFMPHLAAAIATGSTCVVLSLARIALDVDTPEDLCRMAQAPGQKRSQLLARELGFLRTDSDVVRRGLLAPDPVTSKA